MLTCSLWSQSEVLRVEEAGDRRIITLDPSRVSDELSALLVAQNLTAADVTALATALDGLTWADVLTNGATSNTAISLGNHGLGGVATLTVELISSDSLVVAKVIDGRIGSLSNHTTDGLSEGTSNLYYTDARVDARIGVASVEDLSDISSKGSGAIITAAERSKLESIAEGAGVNVNADWNATTGDAQILNKPALATVATSGSYNDLSDAPTSVTAITDVSSAGSGAVITAAERTKLEEIAAEAEVNVNADWTATTGDAQILNRPALATVATSGSYSDLTGTPTSVTAFSDVSSAGSGAIITADERTKLEGIAAEAEVNVNADWDATTGDAEILNKPTLATVATSGSYSDLSGVPTHVSSFTNDVGYSTFDGDYASLTNLPELFSGHYDSLMGAPTSVTAFLDVTDAGSGAIITDAERAFLNGVLITLQSQIDSLEAIITNTDWAALLTFQCGTSTVTFDGYDYATVAIGDQCWFAENLRSEHYFNGDPIPSNLSDAEWIATTSGAVAWQDLAYNNTYGKLYNGYAAIDERGLCPNGWHVAADYEWQLLEMHMGMSEEEAATGAIGAVSLRGTNQGEQLKVTASHVPSWNGTNLVNFSALPAGTRSATTGAIYAVAQNGYFWTSSLVDGALWSRDLYGANSEISRSGDLLEFGASVRCLENTAPRVKTADATGLTANSATLQGEVLADGGENVVAPGFMWSTMPDLSDATAIFGVETAEGFQANLAQLSPSTTYYYSAFAGNGNGTSFGDTLAFSIVIGCGNPSACNYDSAVTVSDEDLCEWDAFPADFTYLSASTSDEPWGRLNWLNAVLSNGGEEYTYAGNGDPIICNGVLAIDGSNDACSFDSFLDTHRALLEEQISAGQVLYINAAPNSCGEGEVVFGVDLVRELAATITAQNGAHPLFATHGAPLSFTGNWASHGYFINYDDSWTVLLKDESNRPVLLEKSFGDGHVIIGGLTIQWPWFDSLHQPLIDYLLSLASG